MTMRLEKEADGRNRRGAPLMSKTPANPGGLSMEVLDGFRAPFLTDRSKFYLDVASGPFLRLKPQARLFLEHRLARVGA
jgi:hypothetical protein